MNYREAANFKLGFGQYKNRSLDQIGATPEGLRYLAWCRSQVPTGQGFIYESTLEFINRYLDEPIVARELELALANHPGA